MALIFSPLTEEILEGPFQPYPRGAFIMMQDNIGTPQVDRDIDDIICKSLQSKHFKPHKATTKRGTKDFLEKIVQLIRGCGFGVAIFSQYTDAKSLANIFFEVGLCNMLGKPVVIVKSQDAQAPSDFVRTEWVSYRDDEKELSNDFSKSLDALIDLSDFFEKLGDLAYEAEIQDFELAYERYKQAVLLNGESKVRKKINTLLSDIDGIIDKKIGLEASRKRLRKAVAEFSQLL